MRSFLGFQVWTLRNMYSAKLCHGEEAAGRLPPLSYPALSLTERMAWMVVLVERQREAGGAMVSRCPQDVRRAYPNGRQWRGAGRGPPPRPPPPCLLGWD